MDYVIVEHQVDGPRPPIAAAEELQKLREDLGVLLMRNPVHDPSRASIQLVVTIPEEYTDGDSITDIF